jgi:hypothetical protein
VKHEQRFGSQPPHTKTSRDEVVRVLLDARAGYNYDEINARCGVPKNIIGAIVRRERFTNVRLADIFSPAQLEREIEERKRAR